MKHFFVDTNVLIDLLTQRDRFGQDAAQLLEAAVQQQVRLYVASLSFSHIYYVLRKTNTSTERRDKLSKLARLVTVVAVDASVIDQALTSALPDFEDALQYYAASSISAIECLVTRDPKGFVGGKMPVLNPADALRLLP